MTAVHDATSTQGHGDRARQCGAYRLAVSPCQVTQGGFGIVRKG
jgi:hypothetical protein